MDPTLGATITRDTVQTAITKSALPEAVELLLDSADIDQVTGEHSWKCLGTALSNHDVSFGVIKVLLDYGRTKGQFQSPNLDIMGNRPNPEDLISHHLSLVNIKTVQERIEVARLIHEYFGNSSDSGYLTGPALARGLRDACASSLPDSVPDSLKVCDMSHGLGASKYIQVDDLVAMIHGAANSHNPTPLLEWVMSIASSIGQKGDLINAF